MPIKILRSSSVSRAVLSTDIESDDELEHEESVELEEAEELDSDDEDRDESDNCISSPSTAILET
jgi:hypothetical protein